MYQIVTSINQKQESKPIQYFCSGKVNQYAFDVYQNLKQAYNLADNPTLRNLFEAAIYECTKMDPLQYSLQHL